MGPVVARDKNAISSRVLSSVGSRVSSGREKQGPEMRQPLTYEKRLPALATLKCAVPTNGWMQTDRKCILMALFGWPTV